MSNGTTSLYFSVQSGNSESTLVSLTDKTRALDKETQLLAQATSNLAKANKQLLENQTRLQTELKSSQQTVNDLQKAYDKYGDELSKSRLDKAIENHAKLKQELTEVNAQLNANQRTYKDYLEAMRKGSVGDAGSGLGSGTDGLTSLGTIVAGLGVWDQVLSLAQSGVGAFMKSALGSDMGDIASGALSSAISGAVLGTTLGGPGLGTAVGALAGGAVGALGGGLEVASSKDDAFKDYYGGLYENVKGRSGEMVAAGSAIAGGREKDRISFKTMFGSEDTADSYLTSLVAMANTTPFLYDDLVSMSKTLATYGYSGDEGDENYILPLLQTIGDTGAALGMSTSDMTSVATALGRMESSNKATLEYLNILNDRGIGAVGMLADAKGVSQGDIYKMISAGKISGTEAVDIITAAMEKAYSGSMLEQSKTFEGISSTLEGLEQELQNSGGDAYNSLRVSGKSDMVAAYQGDLGDAIKEINSIMGENQARKENLQDQYMREVLDAVLNGKLEGEVWEALDAGEQADLTEMSQQYAAAMERYKKGDKYAGAELEAIYEDAQALAQAYFDNSEFMKKLTDIELDEITALRDNTAHLENATQAAYRLSQELSKGYGATSHWEPTMPDWYVSAYEAGSENALKSAGLSKEGIEAMQSAAYSANSHAFGLDRVPYDGYPALLHEGERVLTASQARAEDASRGGSPISVTITGNSFTGTPEEMAAQLAEILVRRLAQAATAAAPR